MLIRLAVHAPRAEVKMSAISKTVMNIFKKKWHPS